MNAFFYWTRCGLFRLRARVCLLTAFDARSLVSDCLGSAAKFVSNKWFGALVFAAIVADRVASGDEAPVRKSAAGNERAAITL